LLTGPTGAGKTRLARRIFELKQARHQIAGRFVELNCATLRGDAAMSAMFGHTRGAFTGAVRERPGVLARADGGVLFLDEIGELGLDEQAMLLRALEDRTFLPVGSDREVSSDFQLIAGTNRDLRAASAPAASATTCSPASTSGPSACRRCASAPRTSSPTSTTSSSATPSATADASPSAAPPGAQFLRFAASPDAVWPGNFRDFAAAVERMATLADPAASSPPRSRPRSPACATTWSEGQVNDDDALCGSTSAPTRSPSSTASTASSSPTSCACACPPAACPTPAAVLFAASRERRSSHNDADRLRKYLQKFDLQWTDLQPA
jgi:transcriptional regulatory protein RtcR